MTPQRERAERCLPPAWSWLRPQLGPHPGPNMWKLRKSRLPSMWEQTGVGLRPRWKRSWKKESLTLIASKLCDSAYSKTWLKQCLTTDQTNWDSFSLGSRKKGEELGEERSFVSFSGQVHREVLPIPRSWIPASFQAWTPTTMAELNLSPQTSPEIHRTEKIEYAYRDIVKKGK